MHETIYSNPLSPIPIPLSTNTQHPCRSMPIPYTPPILTCPTSSLQSSDRCTSDFERVRFGVEDEVVLAVVFDLPDVVLEGDECQYA